ncbi:MAG: biopolymer transporter ExbD [Phycisphaerales bacterium]|nr:biopolymer transporter ExbD [Phycisphaerales bacterium]
MRTSVRSIAPRPSIGFIILPMIDVIFLLLLFFVMVSSFETTARIRIDVPQPEKSRAHAVDDSQQIVVNCEYLHPGDSGAADVHYRIGGDQPQPLETIGRRLAAARSTNPQSTVVVRADHRLPLGRVRQLLRVVESSGFERIQVSAKLQSEL